MPSQRVIPRWPETGEYLPAEFEKGAHGAQHTGRVGVVFERIKGNDDIRWLLSEKTKLADILNAGGNGVLSCYLQHASTSINTKHSASAILCEFQCLGSLHRSRSR